MIEWLGSRFDWACIFIIRRQRELEDLGAAVWRMQNPDYERALVSWGHLQDLANEFLREHG